MTVTGGRVVVTPGEEQPYKVVLEHAQTNDTEYAVASMREGEAFIRSELPFAPAGAFFLGAARQTPLLRGTVRQGPGLPPVKGEQ
jgi:hypothetical protein